MQTNVHINKKQKLFENIFMYSKNVTKPRENYRQESSEILLSKQNKVMKLNKKKTIQKKKREV